MSLADRLKSMERRIAELEQFRAQIMASLAEEEEEEADEQAPAVSLDGERFESGERDQNESLG